MHTGLEEYDLKAIEKGYCCKLDGTYICLVCGCEFKRGEVYRINGRLYHDEKAAQSHVLQAHGERFYYLLNNGVQFLPINEFQKKIIELLYQGFSDREIAKKENVPQEIIVSQCMLFKEKARQAKLYLALYELTTEKQKRRQL